MNKNIFAGLFVLALILMVVTLSTLICFAVEQAIKGNGTFAVLYLAGAAITAVKLFKLYGDSLSQ